MHDGDDKPHEGSPLRSAAPTFATCCSVMIWARRSATCSSFSRLTLSSSQDSALAALSFSRASESAAWKRRQGADNHTPVLMLNLIWGSGALHVPFQASCTPSAMSHRCMSEG